MSRIRLVSSTITPKSMGQAEWDAIVPIRTSSPHTIALGYASSIDCVKYAFDIIKVRSVEHSFDCYLKMKERGHLNRLRNTG